MIKKNDSRKPDVKHRAGAESSETHHGTHPGAYTNDHDVDRDLLDYFELVDLVDLIDADSRKKLIEDEERSDKKSASAPANRASPPATDPPVPNRAHTEM